METAAPMRTLWYDRPAACWEEALPLGSGSLGMMVHGGTAREVLQLNEESLWSGCPAEWDNPACAEHLDEMRALLFQRRYREAQELCCRYLVCAGRGSDDPYYGSFQTAGELVIESPEAADCSGYRRSLDLDTGICTVRFGAVRREHLTSQRYQVTASRLEGGSGCYHLSFARENCRVFCRGAELVAAGQNEALDFCTVVQVETDGTVSAGDGALQITGARRLTLWTSTATSYGTDERPEDICRARLATARAAGYTAVRAEQAERMREAMGRCTLTLPEDPALTALPTDERLARVQAGEEDHGLVRLYFDYGRYLFISSAAGRLPANLQGVWSKDLWTPWTGDYHLNINLQMNYWFVDAVGLEEYGQPLYRYLAFLARHGEKTARVMYRCRGWVAHTLSNPWGFTAPGQDPAWGSFHCGGAWCCRHLYEHYLYTGDLRFLREYWPVIRGSARFFADFLVRDPGSGYLVTAPSNSPENSYRNPADGEKTAVCAGPTMDTMIVRELFTIALRCGAALGEKDELLEQLPDLLAQLPPTRIGAQGGIQEWMEDFEEWEPGHRHISQLYGLYPGWEITPDGTPDLAEASRVTLRRRLAHGGGHTGWSRAWIINFYARLLDGASAGEHLRALLARSTQPNLLDTHPPFQIDGNFGATAGILEMLVQSHEGFLHLLPALPPAWPEGALEGVRVRGGFRLSFRWEAGRVVEGTLFSSLGGPVTLLLNGETVRLETAAGETCPLPMSGRI